MAILTQSTETLGALPTVLDFSPYRLTEEQFDSLAHNQPDLNIELTAEGELVILAPTFPATGAMNADLIFELTLWARKNRKGVVFDSSTLFTFPNGAKRSPDGAWIRREKWDALSSAEKKSFIQLVPDFVVELRSASDSLSNLKAKMAEYISNGVRLGWLVDPLERHVHIYRANGEVEVLNDPESVSGEDVLAGFELPVRELWEVD